MSTLRFCFFLVFPLSWGLWMFARRSPQEYVYRFFPSLFPLILVFSSCPFFLISFKGFDEIEDVRLIVARSVPFLWSGVSWLSSLYSSLPILVICFLRWSISVESFQEELLLCFFFGMGIRFAPTSPFFFFNQKGGFLVSFRLPYPWHDPVSPA